MRVGAEGNCLPAHGSIVRMEGESSGELQLSDTKDRLTRMTLQTGPPSAGIDPCLHRKIAFFIDYLFFYTNQTKEIVLVWVFILIIMGRFEGRVHSAAPGGSVNIDS